MDSFLCWHVIVSLVLIYISFIFSRSRTTHTFFPSSSTWNELKGLCQTVSRQLISSEVNWCFCVLLVLAAFSAMGFFDFRGYSEAGFRACCPFFRALLDFELCPRFCTDIGQFTVGRVFFVLPLSKAQSTLWTVCPASRCLHRPSGVAENFLEPYLRQWSSLPSSCMKFS